MVSEGKMTISTMFTLKQGKLYVLVPLVNIKCTAC